MSMKRILIADAGSSKIDWAVLNLPGGEATQVSSPGVNALLAEDDDVVKALRDVKARLGDIPEFDTIYFYGAGCATDRVCRRMTELIGQVWKCGDIRVSTDLLGAARALLGDERGIACILGTGSNSCLYDGREILVNIPSLGYILGDEGSGAAIGKRFIGDAFKRQLPERLLEDFTESLGLSLSDIIEKVYRQPSPNKFLASLMPYVASNLWNPYVYSVVLQEFKRFFKRNVAMYEGSRSIPIGFVGSVAWNFREVLEEAAASQGFEIGKILRSPIEGLIAYHKTHDA